MKPDATAPRAIERIAARMRERHVSEDIIERVVRLNPNPVEGQRLRGIHYKDADNPAWMCDWVTRGRAIRERGREWLEGLPRDCTVRRGRRQYVTREAWQDFAPRAWL